MSLIDPSRIVDLSEPWSPSSWPYPGHPGSSEEILQSFPRDRVSTMLVSTSMHTGTHVDGPLHGASGVSDLASVPLVRLVRPGYVVDLRDVCDDWHVITPSEVEQRLPGPLEPDDALILRYGWQRFARGHSDEDADRYFNHHPGPGRALIEWMVEREVAWVGTDSASFEHPGNINLRANRPDLVDRMLAVTGSEVFDEESWMLAHRRLLEREQLHVDQVGGDLDAVPAERVTFGIFPWRYMGGEASICRLVAFI